jgi:hypothetical protein
MGIGFAEGEDIGGFLHSCLTLLNLVRFARVRRVRGRYGRTMQCSRYRDGLNVSHRPIAFFQREQLVSAWRSLSMDLLILVSCRHLCNERCFIFTVTRAREACEGLESH